ncbi:MAG: LLM class F420-dependent oxidoreductase [Dehalococcoidia bacterium]|nr:MAG: LLM class F420-dependent oxidoreductase [Dehalococcoidia bacterium]
MAIAMGIGASGDGLTARRVVELGRRMDEVGMDAIWLGEVLYDIFTIYGALSQVTRRLRLAVSVATWARTPPLMSVCASTLEALAPGRTILGLGTMPKFRNEQHHGISYHRPVARMREYLTLMRLLWNAVPGSPIDFAGEFYRIHRYERWSAPESPRLKVYLGAVGPKMLELAGELADGVILHPVHSYRSYTELTLPALQRGLAKRDPKLGPFEIVGSFECSIDDDPRWAIARARNGIMFYFRTPYIMPVMELHGFVEEQRAIRAALDEGDLAKAARLVTDEMVRVLACAGTAEGGAC